MADDFKTRMIKKGASNLVDLGINQYKKMQESPAKSQPVAAESASGSFLADKATDLLNKVFPVVVEGDKASATKGEEKETVTPLDGAFDRLSNIAGSLEEADTHKMIEDIVFLVRTGRKIPEAELTNWVFRLYGRNS